MTDISVTATAVVAASAALVEHGKAGTTITAGQVVYKDPADGLLKLSDNDNASATIRSVFGIALNGGATVSVIKRGSLTLNAVLTKGAVYALSGTPGGIAPIADVTTGDDLIVLGIALSTTVLDVQINPTGVTM